MKTFYYRITLHSWDFPTTGHNCSIKIAVKTKTQGAAARKARQLMRYIIHQAKLSGSIGMYCNKQLIDFHIGDIDVNVKFKVA